MHEQAGLGHRIFELVFALQMALSYRATLHFGEAWAKASEHGSGYEFVETLLGLRHLYSKEMNIKEEEYNLTDFNDVFNTDCKVIYRGNYTSCGGDNCFKSPTMVLAAAKHVDCLRQNAKRHGTWATMSPFRDDYFHVVWHIRVGDRELHTPDDAFYENLIVDLSHYLTAGKVKHHFLAEWTAVSASKENAYRQSITKMLPDAEFISPGIQEAFLVLMHADLLIGSGSSLPMAAALFSGGAFINVRPKHGWNYFCDYIPGLVASDEGRLANHAHEVRSLLKMNAQRR